MNQKRRTFVKSIVCSGSLILTNKLVFTKHLFKDAMKRNVGILIFSDAEVLDFSGPFEVFSVTSQLNDHLYFNVFTISQNKKPVKAVNGLSINPDFDFTDHPHIDILIISGGQGTRQVIQDDVILQWVRKIHQHNELTLSICTGARVLGKLGILHNRPYCTHHETYDHLSEIAPTGVPQKDKRFVQTDHKTYTSGGITAGIDLSFHIVEKLLGKAIAEKTEVYMEYQRTVR